jgi:hypothetical protein
MLVDLAASSTSYPIAPTKGLTVTTVLLSGSAIFAPLAGAIATGAARLASTRKPVAMSICRARFCTGAADSKRPGLTLQTPRP